MPDTVLRIYQCSYRADEKFRHREVKQPVCGHIAEELGFELCLSEHILNYYTILLQDDVKISCHIHFCIHNCGE